jgi:hypothetical protein
MMDSQNVGDRAVRGAIGGELLHGFAALGTVI